MPKISAVIMTLNEERNIERCLVSLQGICDEIVVTDSYSTDRTREICLQYNARFIQHPFEGFIEQRRYSLESATYDHVLVIDADEVISETLKGSILSIKEAWTHDGYYFNRLANYCGQWIRHGEWYPDRKLRVFDRTKASIGGRNPHDEVVMAEGATKRFLKGDLLHYTYYNVEEHIQQINKFTMIQARGSFERGKKPYWFQIIFAPPFKFLKCYILRMGFLDGYYGFLISWNSAYSTFLKHAKLKALYRKQVTDF